MLASSLQSNVENGMGCRLNCVNMYQESVMLIVGFLGILEVDAQVVVDEDHGQHSVAISVCHIFGVRRLIQ